jgi:hypothetical protein
MTSKQILGFVVPCWGDVVELATTAAARLPRVRYVGWDVAITDERGPVLVEGNDMADFDVQQKADQVGKWPLYERAMRSMPTLR